MIKIEGSRIILRDHIYTDIEKMHEWISNDDVMKYLQGMKTTSKEETLIRLSESIKESLKLNREKYYFAIVLKNGEIIGDTGFTIISRNEKGGIASFGYFLNKKYWGQGYGTEAAKLVIDYCFTELSLHKVTAGCDSENKASEKIMLNCGMKKEAEFKKHVFLNGIWRDRYEYAILKDEYKKD